VGRVGNSHKAAYLIGAVHMTVVAQADPPAWLMLPASFVLGMLMFALLARMSQRELHRHPRRPQ
jgi:hypothetical protein